MYNRAIVCFNPLFALWTVKEVEDNTRTRPTLADSLMQAMNMENMTTV
jgi:hypothetical protein